MKKLLFAIPTSLLATLVSFAAEPYASPPRVSLVDFALPTANDALFRDGGEADFFQATVTGDWHSGQYGCVRSSGNQFHEGIDIRCLQRDRSGEPLDAVAAVAPGILAYFNDRPSKSNYGRYIVVQHNVDGIEIFSLYAHLAAVADGLKIGAAVRHGQRLGTLGHTGAGINRERAHVHLELNFMINPSTFEAWYRKHYPKEPNENGAYNGQNLIGLDPAALFRAARANPKLTLTDFVRARPEAFRALVPAKNFHWLERNGWMLSPVSNLQSPVSAYGICFDGFGLPREIIARASNTLTDGQQNSLARNVPVLLSVADAELARCHCRHLVIKSKNGRWQLGDRGLEWLELMTY